MERRAYLLRRAGKRHPVASAGGAGNRESLRFHPGGDFIHVIRTEAELVAVLLRRQPIVIIRRAWILLLREQLRERRLLSGGWLQQQRNAGQSEGIFHRA